MTANAATRIGISKHLLGATVLAGQLALALVIYFLLRPHAMEISPAAALISFALPLAYTISVYKNGPFHKLYPAWASNGHLLFILVPYLVWPYGPPNSIWLWLILAATLVLQILEYGMQHRRKQQATTTQQT